MEAAEEGSPMSASTPVDSRPTPHDPATWKNNAYPLYIVQALPRDKGFAAFDGLTFVSSGPTRRCGREVDRLCRGLSRERTSGAILDRAEALHAVYRHYEFANWSLCRFRSAAKSEYATDLSFDIDAHGKIAGDVDFDFYVPYIAASAEVGAEIVTYLRGELRLDPRYVTTSAGRMGCRVTIDWRAFGPRRLHEVAAVIAVIEARVFGAEGLKRIADKHGIQKVEIDKGPYLRGDHPRKGEDDSNAFQGPWLRPVGSLHIKGSNATLWARVTPVPHGRFVPSEAEWLTWISRGKSQDWRPWEIPGFNPLASAEARIPEFDRLIEDSPAPCTRLIEMFTGESPDAEIAPPVLEQIVRLRHRAAGLQPRKANPDSETTYTDEVILSVLEALDAEPRDLGEYWQIVCPRCGRKGHREATVFRASGWLKCFRDGCIFGMPLHDLAVEKGLAHLLPSRGQTNIPLRRLPLDEVPKGTTLDWGEFADVISPSCDTIDAFTTERRKAYQSVLAANDHGVRVFVDRSSTGTGKTTTAQDLLEESSIRYRVLVPRDEHKDSWVARVMDTMSIVGRRPDETCTHPDLAEVASRRESVERVLCRTCPRKPIPLPADGSPRTTNVADPCPYWMQFDGAADKNLALSHQHGLADIDRLRNDSAIDIIDEDPLSAVVSDAHTDLTGPELDLFDAVAERVHEGADGPVEDVDLDMPNRIVRRPVTARIGVILERLRHILAGDPIADADPKLAASGQVADAALSRLLFRNDEFRAAVHGLTDADLEAHAAAREELREMRASLTRLERGFYLPREVEATWVPPDGADTIDELLAFETWQRPRLRPLTAKPPTRAEVEPYRLPIDVLPGLRDSLAEMLNAHESQYGLTSPLFAYRGSTSGPWTLRLTKARSILKNSKRILVLSATVTPERLRLAVGPASENVRWVIFDPKSTAREERIQIADRLYGKGTLVGETKRKDRERVFETVKQIIADEFERTGLPVAVIGPSEIMNLFVEWRLGHRVDRELRFPLRGGGDRAERLERLHAITTPHHFLPGYAFGVSGSNAFALPDGRFVRSVILLGAPIPNLGAVARDHRGLYAGKEEIVERDVPGIGPMPVGRPIVLDWSITHRKVAFEGTSDGSTVLAACNVPGYADDRANEILAGTMEGEMLQVLGRLRFHVSDAAGGPTPRAYIFSGIAIAGYEVDRVLGLEELRKEIGLDAKLEPKKRGRAIPDLSLPERLRQEVKKRGRKYTIDLLTRGLLGNGSDPEWVETQVRILFEQAGLAEQACVVPPGHHGPTRPSGFTRGDRETVRDAVARVRGE